MNEDLNKNENEKDINNVNQTVIEIKEKKTFKSILKKIGKVILFIFVGFWLLVMLLGFIGNSCGYNSTSSQRDQVELSQRRNAKDITNTEYNSCLNIDFNPDNMQVIDAFVIVPIGDSNVICTTTEWNLFSSAYNSNNTILYGRIYLGDSVVNTKFSISLNKISAYTWCINLNWLDNLGSYSWCISYVNIANSSNAKVMWNSSNTLYQYQAVIISNLASLEFDFVPNPNYTWDSTSTLYEFFTDLSSNAGLDFKEYDGRNRDTGVVFNLISFDYERYYEQLQIDNDNMTEQIYTLEDTNQRLQQTVDDYDGLTYDEIWDLGHYQGELDATGFNLGDLVGGIIKAPIDCVEQSLNFDIPGTNINFYDIFRFAFTMLCFGILIKFLF